MTVGDIQIVEYKNNWDYKNTDSILTNVSVVCSFSDDLHDLSQLRNLQVCTDMQIHITHTGT